MRIYSRSTLIAFWESGSADAEGPLKAWHAEAEKATWEGPEDIKARYSSASFVGSDRVVFNIGGNKYRLICMVKYAPFYAVYVRFIGTHAEYNSVDASTV